MATEVLDNKIKEDIRKQSDETIKMLDNKLENKIKDFHVKINKEQEYIWM